MVVLVTAVTLAAAVPAVGGEQHVARVRVGVEEPVDEARLLHVLQRLANRLTTGIVLAALVVGAALMMQVPTDSTILGYPSIAMVFFLLAAIGGAALVVSIVVTDRKVAREEGRARDPRL